MTLTSQIYLIVLAECILGSFSELLRNFEKFLWVVEVLCLVLSAVTQLLFLKAKQFMDFAETGQNLR